MLISTILIVNLISYVNSYLGCVDSHSDLVVCWPGLVNNELDTKTKAPS